MSGGSYNYLYSKDLEDILDDLDTLQRMMMTLDGLSYGGSAAMDTQILHRTLLAMGLILRPMIEKLSPVWRAVEWWESSDSSEESVKAAVELYNRGTTDSERRG